ncbi:MAG: hypothetical protein Q7S47_01995 [bacterium]|nr:hypothetical protein [bacterium]
MRLIEILISGLLVLATPLIVNAESAVGSKRSVERSPQAVQQGMLVLRRLVETHPDLLVRRTLSGWIGSGVISISMESDLMPSEMAMEIVKINGAELLVLVANPNFLLRRQLATQKDDMLYKQLVIYHETTHAADHLAGRIRLTPAITPNDPKMIAAKARSLWMAEYSATFAEWKLAKKISATHLMSNIKKSIAIHGERRGFLEAFAPLMFRGAMVSNPAPFLPTWKKMYQEEKKRLR